MSKIYTFKSVQIIPILPDKAWNFFSNPSNLQTITPDDMNFTIISNYQSEKMYAAQIIEYRVKPLSRFSMHWMTEITHVEEKKYFIDEQRFGPYSLWRHQHHFKTIEGGVEMTDIIHYKIPFWFLGDLANWLFVNSKLKKIFSYRAKKIQELFPGK